MLRALALSLLLGISAAVLAETPQRLAGLQAAARITIDDEGISHVRADNEHDLYFMQGWVHAGDRLFQMDYNRRLASGTLAELVGMAALTTDVQLRTLGLRRGAQRSLDAASPRSEEHTSELQSLAYLVCRLLLEKKKKKKSNSYTTRRFSQAANHD